MFLSWIIYAKYQKKEEEKQEQKEIVEESPSQEQKEIVEESPSQEQVIEKAEISESTEQQLQTTVYTQMFKKPKGSVNYYDEYGSFSNPPNYRGPYLMVK